MEEDFIALLLSSAALAGLCEKRIHWQVQPDEVAALPYVNLLVVSRPYSTGVSRGPRGRWARVQVDVWGETEVEAKAVRDAFVALVDAHRSSGVIKVLSILSARQMRGKSEPVLRGWSLDVSIQGDWL